MVGYELVKTVGGAAATYKFTPKFVLKAGQKVTVRTDLLIFGRRFEAQEFKITIVLEKLMQELQFVPVYSLIISRVSFCQCDVVLCEGDCSSVFAACRFGHLMLV